jgi:hypothetical protein
MEELKPLLRILLASIPRTNDKQIRLRASDLWNLLLVKRGGKTVAEACFATLAAASKRSADPASLATIFVWSCELAYATSLKYSSEEAVLQAASFSKLAQLQFTTFARMIDANADDISRTCSAKFGVPLRRCKRAFAAYMDALMQCKDPSEIIGGATLLLAYSQSAKRASTPESVEARAKFVTLYKAAVLAATEGRDGRKASPQMTQAFKPMFKTLTHDDVGPLVPEMCRVLRRTPELFIGSVSESLMHMSVDTSRYVEQFTAILVERLAMEKFRTDALALTTSFAHQSSELSVLAQLGGEILKKVNSKDIKNWQERLGLVQGINVLLSVPKGKGINTLADDCLQPLTALAAKEANDETRCALYAVLGCCMRRSEKLPADTVKLLTKDFEHGVDSVRRAALVCVKEALQAHELREKAGEFVAGLCKVMQAADKKPGLRGDAVFAARSLLLLAAADDSVATKMEQANVWGYLASPGSYMGALIAADTTTVDELLALGEVTDLLLKDHGDRLAKGKGEGRTTVISLMVGVLVSSHHCVHAALAKAIKATLSNDPTVEKEMVEQLHQRMRSESTGAKQLLPSQEPAQAAPSQTYLGVRFGRALLAVVSGAPPNSILGRIMLMAHSPLVLSGPRARNGDGLPAIWCEFGQRYASRDGGFNAVVRECAEVLCAEILSEQGIRSDSEFDRACALAAIESLSRQALLESLDTVVDAVRADLDAETICSLTDKDIIIYRTPDGQLARFEQLESGYVPQTREDRNVRINKEDKKLYGALAKEFAAEREAKKNQEKPKMTKQEEEVFKARLAEEARVRATVAAVRASAELGLSVLEALCRGNRAGMHSHLSLIAPLVWPLARAPQRLVGVHVLCVARAMALCCTRRLSPQIPEALYIVAAGPSHETMTSEEAALVRNAVRVLQKDMRGQPLPVQSFTYVFPLLRYALLSPSVGGELQDAAMRTVAQHTSPAEPWPRCTMIGVLIAVMSTNARMRKAAADVVLKLCVALGPRDVSELLDGCLTAEAAVRSACLDSLAAVSALPGDEPHKVCACVVLPSCVRDQ